jgi:hypothetical protein
LIGGKTAIGFAVAPEVKFSSVDGRFAQFGGFHAGIVINQRLTLGVAGYAKATDYLDYGMAYGGLFVEYLVDSRGPFHFSVGGLLGGGTAHELWFIPWWKSGRIFAVAEPQGKLSVNLAEWIRLGIGGGYRFVSGGDGHKPNLSGPTLSLSLAFGLF